MVLARSRLLASYLAPPPLPPGTDHFSPLPFGPAGNDGGHPSRVMTPGKGSEGPAYDYDHDQNHDYDYGYDVDYDYGSDSDSDYDCAYCDDDDDDDDQASYDYEGRLRGTQGELATPRPSSPALSG